MESAEQRAIEQLSNYRQKQARIKVLSKYSADASNENDEMRELRTALDRIDTVMKALEEYKPDYAMLLRLRYIDGWKVEDAAAEMYISGRTFRRWRDRAIGEFAKVYAREMITPQLESMGEVKKRTMKLTPDELQEVHKVMTEAVQSLNDNPKLERLFKSGRCIMSPVTFTVHYEAEIFDL